MEGLNMNVATVRMSSKGQIVVPQEVREELNATEGTVFAVIGSKNMVVLKKIETPSKEVLINELEAIARDGRKRLEKKGIKEADILKIVQRSRAR